MGEDPCGAAVIRWGYPRKCPTAVASGKECYDCRRARRADAPLAVFRVFRVRALEVVVVSVILVACHLCVIVFLSNATRLRTTR